MQLRVWVYGLVGAVIWAAAVAGADSAPTFNLEDPAALHRALAAEKAAHVQTAREAGVATGASLAQLDYDARYYDLDIALLVSLGQVAGRVHMQATSLVDNLTQFDVDLYTALVADSVFVGGSPAPFSHTGNELFIQLPGALQTGDPFDMTVYYHGNPASGGFGAFGFNQHGSPATPVVWSLSEPYYARNWWPCKDTPSDKADSVDVHITCPNTLYATSNGLLQSTVDHPDGTRTYNWHEGHPITTYLVSLTATNFVQLDDEFVYNSGADTMPVYYWVYPEKQADALASYPEVPQMIGALGELYGPYPFLDEKYAITQFPWGGGMEHQTNTSQSPTWYSWSLNVHELSHQWWGDNVTCATWSDIWLNEGFASYSEALYQEWLYGTAAYKSYINSMAYKGGGTIYVSDTSNVNTIFNGGLSYDKGAYVLHMLRHVLGDATFFDCLAAYRSQYTGQSATTQDFRAVCEQVSGLDLDPFFNDWIYGTLFPRYIYSFYSEPDGGGYLAHVRIEQMQVSSPQVFDMPIDLRFTLGGLNATRVVQNNERIQWFALSLPFDPAGLVLDPDTWILKDAYAGVAILSDTLKEAARDEYYSDTLEAVRGTPPYYWYKVDGTSYPPGLSMGTNGVLSGTAAVQGTFTFTAQVLDSGVPQTSMERDITVTIGTPLRPAGDVTDDNQVTLSDVIFLVNYVYKAGPAPVPAAYGDVDLSCTINSADVIYLVNYIFKGGAAPYDGCAP
jgi:aminopeptidase N